MNSIVLELQKDCLDSRVPVTDLLRKALLIAKKLHQIDFEKWVTFEIDGYGKKQKIPEYRIVQGEIKAWNPFNGWVPVFFQEHQMAELLRKRSIGSSISELESLVMDKNPSSTLQVPFSPETEARLMRGADLPLKPTLHVSSSQINGIIEKVRKTILEWTLKLEQEGILGENLQFSKKEVESASSPLFTVQNFFGPITGSQIQQGSRNSPQTINSGNPSGNLESFLCELKKDIANLGLNKNQEAELSSEIATLEAQIASPNPKPTILNESLKSTRSILEGTAGSIIATRLLEILQGII